MSRLIYLFLLLCLISCEKDINIDYHEAASRFVVEGKISATGTEIRVSKTNAVDNNATGSDVDNATVVISGDDGTRATIPFSRNGYYRSKLKGTPGVLYQLPSGQLKAQSPRLKAVAREHTVQNRRPEPA